MDLSTTLQLINATLLGVFGVAGWRMVEEWRKSHEAKHAAEMAGSRNEVAALKTQIASLEERQRLELQSRDDQIGRLKDDNVRLAQKRDERTAILEEQISFLKSQSPAGVAANFDALKRWHTQQLEGQEQKLDECQSALAREKAEHQALLAARDARIEELKGNTAHSGASACCEIGLQIILPGPTALQREYRDEYQSRIRVGKKKWSAWELIRALEHWDPNVREIAAQELASRGNDSVSDLVDGLHGGPLTNLGLKILGRFCGRKIQRFVEIIRVLASIGDPAVGVLNERLMSPEWRPRARAIIALRCINTERANEVLQRVLLN